MAKSAGMAHVKVFKFDPALDALPRFETFKGPYQGMTVLDTLEAIRRDFDPELAFRSGCEGRHDSRCGACALEVNGACALACRLLSQQEMVIAPHPRFEVVRDLVVDFNRIRKEAPRKTSALKVRIDPEKCIRCGDCIHLCPVGVFKAVKAEMTAAYPRYCCGGSCRQCVTYCQAGAIFLEQI